MAACCANPAALGSAGAVLQAGSDEGDSMPRFVTRELVLAQEEGGAAQRVLTTCGSLAKEFILSVNGGGLGLGDLSGDGVLDLVVVDGSTIERVRAGEPGLPPRALIGDGAGGFRRPPAGFDMAGGRFGMGCALGDVDADGDLDLVVTEWGPDRLFLNDDGAGLTEHTAESGLTGDGWSTSAAFLDADLDGALDLAIGGYLDFDLDSIPASTEGECRWRGLDVMCGPEGLAPQPDRFFRGVGDGTFVDASEAAGLTAVEPGFTLGVVALDYDADGDVDLYLACDSTPNRLFENRGDGTFEERGARRAVARDRNGREQAGMGIATGDLNGDGLPELAVTNFSGETHALYQSRRTRSGEVAFTERSNVWRLTGPSLSRLSWGTTLIDVEHDGDLDLIVMNGHVYPQADRPGTDTSYAQEDDLFLNEGERFARSRVSEWPVGVSRALTRGDLDGDGDLDLVSLQVEGAVLIHESVGAKGTWLSVAPERGLGARVELRFGAGDSRTAQVVGSAGYQAAQPETVHFGLGTLEQVPQVIVRWPGGDEVVVREVPAGAVLEVARPSAEPRGEGEESR